MSIMLDLKYDKFSTIIISVTCAYTACMDSYIGIVQHTYFVCVYDAMWLKN